MGEKEQRFIITCNHVIPDEKTAKSSTFSFNYIDIQNDPNEIDGSDLFDMTAKQWFWSDQVRTQ